MYPDPYGHDSECHFEPSEYPGASCYDAGESRRARRHGCRHGGWWVFAALLLLVGGSVWLFSRYSFELRHTDNGMTLVVRDPDSAMTDSPPVVETEQPQPLQPKAAGAGPRFRPASPTRG